MPLYEYACLNCGHRFEALRRIKDADATLPCEKCHSNNVKRAISVFNAVSNGVSITKSNSDCSGCSGGTCSSCGV